MLAAQASVDALPADDDWAVRAADLLIRAAAAARCSDLHFFCRRDFAVARGRRDGALIELARIPAERADFLVARFKVLAGLPAFIRKEPQDGRIEWSPSPAAPSQRLRISFLPTIHGENVVIRFPEGEERLLRMESLGMTETILTAADRLLARQEGLILLTGPSSSGKTSTLYAMLMRLNERRGDRCNILTIEDPVERDLGFAGQTQVDLAQNLSFERALRSALRQDPNVLMIGEIRDPDSARIAAQAGMTGHLVLSTIHAGRAERVIPRLLSIGVEPYMAASAFAGAIAQRLVRLLCDNCKRPAVETDPNAGWSVSGCEKCAFTGAQGRTGVFELIEADEGLRAAILEKRAPGELAAIAAGRQCGSMGREGLRLLAEGKISRLEYDAAAFEGMGGDGET